MTGGVADRMAAELRDVNAGVVREFPMADTPALRERADAWLAASTSEAAAPVATKAAAKLARPT